MKKTDSRQKRKAFALIEMPLVIFIFGLLVLAMGVVFSKANGDWIWPLLVPGAFCTLLGGGFVFFALFAGRRTK